jgi:hypothetical protein
METMCDLSLFLAGVQKMKLGEIMSTQQQQNNKNKESDWGERDAPAYE